MTGPFIAFFVVEGKSLIRARTPFIFLFLVPVVMALILGPATSIAFGNDASSRSLLGYAVLFCFISVSFAGYALYRDHWSGTATRIAIYRPSPLAMVAGKLAPIGLLGFAQLAVFITLARVFLGLPFEGSAVALLAAAGAAVMGAVVAVLIGAALYVRTSAASAFQAFNYLVLLGGGALGGAIVPFESLPGFSRFLGRITPQYWLLRTFEAAFYGRYSAGEALIGVAVLILYAFVLVLIVLRWFDPLTERSATW